MDENIHHLGDTKTVTEIVKRIVSIVPLYFDLCKNKVHIKIKCLLYYQLEFVFIYEAD